MRGARRAAGWALQQSADLAKGAGTLWLGLWLGLRRGGPSQVRFWFIALAVGIVAGLAALGFRKGIIALQTFVYGESDVRLASAAGDLPWWWLLILPILGGLAVGAILNRYTGDGRVHSVADVISGAALLDGRVEIRAGLASALASLITLSTGGSTGREGPVVHLAGVISTWVNDRIGARGITARDLLGCAVAAAVSASFNAPIAGTLFALEVVLRHFALHAFAPIAIAAVAGTVINRLQFGGVTEFLVHDAGKLTFFVELPAFLILGLVSGLVAAATMRLMLWSEEQANRAVAATGLPRWLRPAAAGVLLGLIAIVYPHIIGVGYETTAAALTGRLGLHEAVVFAVVKCIALAITVAGRMGGGVFSPSLMMGALTGLAFGLIATAVFPEVSGSVTIYALAGMGAVAAAVLGAPISTAMIVFELTGDWQTGLAVLTAVSLSSATASRFVYRSFFLTQLERRGVRLAAGPQEYLLGALRVEPIMRRPGQPGFPDAAVCRDLAAKGLSLPRNATLAEAMPLLERAGTGFVPVIGRTRDGAPVGAPDGSPEVVGALFEVDALRAHNRALSAVAAEEHS